ncbi:MAG: PQQ-like beta-propeller repeat protein [Planctomycetales bacterium]|nr:PQQ-like beta-propeller repeat protein [Planctomycetales bacterium]
MKSKLIVGLWALGSVFNVVNRVGADDWPQWMGANRDARVSDFQTPKSWPSDLKKQWSVEVGNGVATPALVGKRLFAFGRQGEDEVVRCLDSETGQEIWTYRYPTAGAVGPSQSFPGPRSCPTVAEGKVIVYGVRGKLSCLDASTGEVDWQSDEPENNLPRFYTSSSPVIAGGLCIAQRGGEDSGTTVAYNLADGEMQWTWQGPGTAYSSPKLATIDGKQFVIVESDESVVALTVSNGKVAWEMPYVVTGRGYNAATPVMDGNNLIVTGSNRGAKALQLSGAGDKLAAKEVWSNEDNSVQYNTPVLKSGQIYGLSASDVLFCINTQTGKTNWSAPVREGAGESGAGQASQAGGQPPRRGPGGGSRGGPGGVRPGYGSIVDAGDVLIVLTPIGELAVLRPNPAQLEKIASYKVAEGQTYAYPVLTGNRIYIKDGESLSLFTLN